MKKILLLALAATTFFACSKEDGETPANGETKKVRLAIKSVETAGTKTTEDAGTEHKTPVADFTAYFLNSSDGVVETRKTASESSGVYLFDGVSGLATKVFIVANTDLTQTTLTGSILSELKSNLLEIKTYQTGIDKVILAAADASAITAKSALPEDAGEYVATVTIAPVVARLEIAQLQAVSAGDLTISDITEFTVANIYVNGYDPKMPLVGTATGRKPGTTADFTNTDLKDLLVNISSVNNIAKPATAGNVWAYQLFPGAAPTMVIQFSSVTFENGTTLSTATGTPADELCITVTGFTPNTFAAAKIYHVNNIEFNSKNIGKPYEATKNISVTLSVTGWTIEATTVTLQ